MVADSLARHPAVSGRSNLLDVLTFLERRGASPEVLQLAMVRAGITVDVAQLLSRCMVSGDLAPLAAPAPAAAPTIAADSTSAASERALRWLAGTFVLWGGLVAGGLGLGFAIGMEIGVVHGFEEGMDNFQAALQLALQY